MTSDAPSPERLASAVADSTRALLEAIRSTPEPWRTAHLMGDLIAAQALLSHVYDELARQHHHADAADVRGPRASREAGAASLTAARLESAAVRAELVETWLLSAHASAAQVEWGHAAPATRVA